MAANTAAAGGNLLGGILEKERAVQREYWEEHSKKQGSSMENMMLDKSAAKLDLMDRPEILSLLPPYAGTRILELASGIGRFTGSLAQAAASVVTVEFMEDFLEKNRELNKHHGNVDFICADVLALELPAASFDLVFSCWIQMYLNDDEVRLLAARTLQWMRPGGHAFFRESCFRQSGDVSRNFNPSHYRHPSFYTKVFSEVRCEDAEGGVWGLELVRSRNLETYVEVKGNKGQICWLWRKVRVESAGVPAAAAAAPGNGVPAPSSSPPLPATALSSAAAAPPAGGTLPNALLSPPAAGPLATHDGLFGAGFGSDRLGGLGPAQCLAEALQVGRGDRVVDWASGLGGFGLMAAEKYGAKVWSVEARTAQVEMAVQNAMAHPAAHTVLEACPLEARDFDAGSVDAVLVASTDDATISSLPRVARWLKAGGRVVVGVLGSAADAEAVHAALAQATGDAAASLTDMSAQMAEWLARDLEALRLRRQKGQEGQQPEAAPANGNGAASNGHAMNGNGHCAAPAAAAAAAASSSSSSASASASQGGLDEEADRRWSSALAQAKAGALRYYVVKAIRQ